MVKCNECGSTNVRKEGRTSYGKQKYKCKDCGRQGVDFTEDETKNIIMTKSECTDKKGLSLQQLREKYDVMTIIRNGCKQLQKDDIITLSEFKSRLNLPGNVSHREAFFAPEFEQYRGKISNDDIRWSHPVTITLAKEEKLLKPVTI